MRFMRVNVAIVDSDDDDVVIIGSIVAIVGQKKVESLFCGECSFFVLR